MGDTAERNHNKSFKKILLAIVSIILIIVVTFIVANIVHNSGTKPTSTKVENGLSAYELAVEQGYNGSLEEWLKSLDGKSAYEIAVENGYSGTENE